MASDMFLKLDGIVGESIDATHKGEIDIVSWSWGMTQTGTTHTATGGGGKVSVQDLHLIKRTDKSTPNLMVAACIGQPFAKAVVTVRKAGIAPFEFLKLTVWDAVISSLENSGAATGAQIPTEQLALNFAKFEIAYTVQNVDGTKGPSFISNFDLVRNIST